MHGRKTVAASHEPPPERGLAVRRRNTGFMGIMQFKRNWVLPMNLPRTVDVLVRSQNALCSSKWTAARSDLRPLAVASRA
jgi:hypothetical protein